MVPWLDGTPGPAIPVQNARTLRFDGPTYDIAFVVLHVEINLAVRIGPHEFRCSPFDGYRMIPVVSGIPVVRRHRAANHQKAHDQGKGHYQLGVHVPPSQIEFVTTAEFFDRALL